MMLQKVRADSTLSDSLRGRFRRLTGPVAPAQALQRAQVFAREELPKLPREEPTGSLGRVLSASTFLRYASKPEVRDTFTTVDDFIRFVESGDNGESVIWDFLTPGPVVFPWERSWLAELAPLRGLTGAEIVRALEITSDPPFVLFELSVKTMREANVTVRTPCSLDSLLGPNPQWRPGGPASGIREYIDGDVPRTAISAVRWVP